MEFLKELWAFLRVRKKLWLAPIIIVMLIIGGENSGISEDLLAASDEAIRIPMAGFTPSYNLQAPMAVVAVEALRQRRS